MNTEEGKRADAKTHVAASVEDLRARVYVALDAEDFDELDRLLVLAEEQGNAWREEAWQCYLEAGADPDGDDSRHLNPGEAVAAVKRMREQDEEGHNMDWAAAQESLRLADEMERAESAYLETQDRSLPLGFGAAMEANAKREAKRTASAYRSSRKERPDG